MATRIAIANHKGGVAKSTTTLMVAEGLAYFHAMRVLVLDMDPQCSISTMLLSTTGADAAAAHGRSLSALLTTLAAGKPIQLSRLLSTKASDLIELRDAPDRRRVDLLASNRSLLVDLASIEDDLRARYTSALDIALAQALDPELDRLHKSYDAILFDCPAGTPPIGIAALHLAHHIIAPTVLDAVSLKSLGDFMHIILQHNGAIADRVRMTVLPTLFQTGDAEQRRNLDLLRADTQRLNAVPRPVPLTVHLRRAGERLRPDAYRSMREKYAGAVADVATLAQSVHAIIQHQEPKP